MNELVFKSEKGNPVTNSLLVAEKFEKQHKHVLEAIDEIVKGYAEKSATLFYETFYVHPQNKQRYRMYVMTRDGFSMLVMGFNGDKATNFKFDFIEAFNLMEEELKTKQLDFSDPNTILKLAQSWKEEYDKRLALEQKVEEDKPRVTFALAVGETKDTVLIADLAKSIAQNGIDIGEIRLYKWLRNNGYLCKHGSEYNMPAQRYIEMGIFRIRKHTIEKPNGDTIVRNTTMVTGKGQIYLMDKFLKSYNNGNF